MTERTRLFTGYTCNIKCKFCFYKGKKEIPKINDVIYRQMLIGRKYGIKDWDISGGEPTILPDWFLLLDRLKDLGFRNIACITNGYKFSKPGFLIKSVNHGLNEILFSLHGFTKQVHF